jgi:23S rRNA (cytidine2498-2'-O)-methyltransferase
LGQESFISQELSPISEGVQCTYVAPGVVELTGVDLSFLSKNPILFSRQLLPQAFQVEGNSIKTFAAGIVRGLIEQLPTESEPWNLYIFEPATADSGEAYSRARLIQQETVSLLKQKRRSLLKGLTDEISDDAVLVQVLLADRNVVFMSVTRPDTRRSLQSLCTPRLGGYIDIPDDQRPPSRAFKKLEEALAIFGLNVKTGDTCVDLGACPGGWTHVMVARGAHVTAIDRSPVDDRLMGHKNVSFVKGDAFTWVPGKPVTWLICDVITTPDRTLKILDSWLSKRHCSLFCVTVKFKGTPDFQSLAAIRSLLTEKTTWFDGKQLAHNKNELTVVGKV